MTAPPKVWDDILRRLEAEVPASVLGAWLRDLEVEMDDNQVLRLTCRSDFHRARIRKRWLPIIRTAAQNVSNREVRVELAAELGEPRQPHAPVDEPRPAAPEPQPASCSGIQAPVEAAKDRPSDEAIHGLLTFDNFVVGPCNNLAREASLALIQPEATSLRQLYLGAASGLGKTHLCRALVAEAQRTGSRRVVYTSAENFTGEFTTSLRNRQIGRFKRRYRSDCDVLIVEDVQFLEGKKATQLELFHTLQHLLDTGRRVVVTGDRLPRELVGLDERVRSQLSSGMVAPMDDPSALVRRRILRSKAACGGVSVPPDCLDMLVESVRGNVRDLEGALVQLVTTASLLKRKIDVELTRQALQAKTFLAPEATQRNLGQVIRTVARFFHTTPEAMVSRSRRRDVLVPRQLAMYLCHRYSEASLAEIGRALGRDHPAVSNAIRRIEREILERAPLRYQVEALCDRLRDDPD